MVSESPTEFDGWRYESHYGGGRKGTHSLDAASLTLDFEELDDSRFLKEFQLQPGQRFCAIVHAVGTNVETQNPGGVGANVCLNGTWQHSHEFEQGSGTFEGDLKVDFMVPASGSVEIGLRLGFWCSEAKGKVVFSNFRLEEDTSRMTFGNGQIRLTVTLEEAEVLLDEAVNRFLERIAAVYYSMGALYGKFPFNSDPVYYETDPSVQAWAYAGNPIMWNSQCCMDYFLSLENGDNACFGAIHEMGHNFEQSRVSDLNHEMIANFALCYAVEQLNLPIHFDGEFTVGRGLQDGFYHRCYERTIKAGQYHHDGLLYCILRVKDSIGWGAFETVMRQLITNPPPKQGKPETFQLWMKMLSDCSGTDVKSTFVDNEWDFICSQEEF
jgi:hypothetical protein